MAYFFSAFKALGHLYNKIKNTQETNFEITVAVNNVLHYWTAGN